MLPFLVDKSWFEKYWYDEPPRRKRRPLAMSLTRFAVCVVLVLGGAIAVGQLHSGGRAAHVTRTHVMIE